MTTDLSVSSVGSWGVKPLRRGSSKRDKLWLSVSSVGSWGVKPLSRMPPQLFIHAFSILCRIVGGETLLALALALPHLHFQYPLSDRGG